MKFVDEKNNYIKNKLNFEKIREGLTCVGRRKKPKKKTRKTWLLNITLHESTTPFSGHKVSVIKYVFEYSKHILLLIIFYYKINHLFLYKIFMSVILK